MSDPKPIYWNCPCNVRFRIGEETTIRGYHRQPWFSHFEVDCPHCHKVFIAFQPPDIILNAMLTQNPEDKCEIEFSDYAPDHIVMRFAQERGLVYIPLDWLPEDKRSVRRRDHDEHIIAFFHYLLEQGEGCDDEAG